MNNLYYISDYYTSGFNAGILDLISLASIFCGVLVIISKNPIVSVLFLIGLFLAISSYLISVGLGFIGLSYLLVYVGAVSILFLFILMLINVRVSELLSNTSKSIPLAISASSILLIILFRIFINPDTNPESFMKFSWSISQLFSVTANSWDGNLAETSHITSIGNIMYTTYAIWLIITSLILLLAMVGAIVITIKQNVDFYMDKIKNNILYLETLIYKASFVYRNLFLTIILLTCWCAYLIGLGFISVRLDLYNLPYLLDYYLQALATNNIDGIHEILDNNGTGFYSRKTTIIDITKTGELGTVNTLVETNSESRTSTNNNVGSSTSISGPSRDPRPKKSIIKKILSLISK